MSLLQVLTSSLWSSIQREHEGQEWRELSSAPFVSRQLLQPLSTPPLQQANSNQHPAREYSSSAAEIPVLHILPPDTRVPLARKLHLGSTCSVWHESCSYRSDLKERFQERCYQIQEAENVKGIRTCVHKRQKIRQEIVRMTCSQAQYLVTILQLQHKPAEQRDEQQQRICKTPMIHWSQNLSLPQSSHISHWWDRNISLFVCISKSPMCLLHVVLLVKGVKWDLERLPAQRSTPKHEHGGSHGSPGCSATPVSGVPQHSTTARPERRGKP